MLRCGDRFGYCGLGVREELQLWCLPNSAHEGDGSIAIFAMISVLLVEKVVAVAGVKLLML